MPCVCGVKALSRHYQQQHVGAFFVCWWVVSALVRRFQLLFGKWCTHEKEAHPTVLWEQWNFPCSIQLQVLRCSDRMSPLVIILLTRCFLFWGNTQQNCVSFDSKLFTTKNGIKTCFGQQSMQQIKALFSIRFNAKGPWEMCTWSYWPWIWPACTWNDFIISSSQIRL